jgi:Tfp pilus assembly protein PilO
VNRRHLALVSAAVVLVLVAWFLLLWSPKGAQLADARERRTAAQDRVTQLQAKLGELEAVQKKGPALERLAAAVRSAVPSTPDLAAFLLSVDDAAAKAHVTYKAVAPSPVQLSTTGGPNEVPISFTVEGGWGAVLDFMDRLVALPRVVVLDRVGLNAEASDTGATTIGVTLTGRVFTTAAPSSPTAVAGATPAATPVTQVGP